MRYCLMVFQVLLLALLMTACAGGLTQKKQGEVHYMLGLSYLGEQNATLALKEFLQAEQFDPKNATIQAALGQTLQLKQAYGEAEAHYALALKYRPGDPTLHNNLGALYLDMQRWDDAIRHFQAAASNLLFTTPEVSLTGMGDAYYHKGDYLQAVAAYKKALRQKARYGMANLRLGETYYALGKIDLAIGEYRKAIKTFPEYALAYYRLGLAQSRKGARDEAIEAFRKVKELVPGTELAQLASDSLELLR